MAKEVEDFTDEDWARICGVAEIHFFGFPHRDDTINTQLDRLIEVFRLPYTCERGCGYPVPTPGPCGECFSGR